MQIIKGIAVSPGIIVGRAFLVGTAEQVVPHRIIDPSEVTAQHARLHAALAAASAEIDELRERTRRELGPEPAKIFEFHAGLLRDRVLEAHHATVHLEATRAHGGGEPIEALEG